MSVIAVDLGTSRSGFAWTPVAGGAVEIGFCGDKEPTALLLDAQGATLAFGRAAVEQYWSAAPADQQAWLFFDNFKMELHARENAHVAARNGVQLPLDDIFAATLCALKEAALQAAAAASAADVLWVLTVPAIWDERAKQFMRRAATRAGLVDDVSSPRLILCLEPEGACVAVHRDHLNGGIAMDEKFLVLDCGGGTVDVTAHFVEDSPDPFRVAGLLPPSGGPWGGTYVDAQFASFVQELLGGSSDPVPPAIMLKWERAKCAFTGDNPKKVNLSELDRDDLSELVNQFQQRHPELNPPVKLRGAHNLVLPAQLVRSFFEPVLQKIEAHVADLLQRDELRDLNYIFLVGGFAASAVLQERMRARFPRLVIPPRPGVAVVHGAALVGRDPHIFTARVTGFTYGIESTPTFDPSNPLHTAPDADTTTHPGRVKYMFEPFVRKGDVIAVDETVTRRRWPLTHAQTKITIVVFSAAKRDAHYTTDPDVQRLVAISLPVDVDVPMRDRGFDVHMRFGGSDIKITAVRVTDGRQAHASVDFDFLDDAASRISGQGVKRGRAGAGGGSGMPAAHRVKRDPGPAGAWAGPNVKPDPGPS